MAGSPAASLREKSCPMWTTIITSCRSMAALHLGEARIAADLGEGGGALEAADQLLGGQAPILVQHADGHVAHLQGRRVGEQEQLDQRRHDERHARARVAEGREQLLDDEGAEAGPDHASGSLNRASGAC